MKLRLVAFMCLVLAPTASAFWIPSLTATYERLFGNHANNVPAVSLCYIPFGMYVFPPANNLPFSAYWSNNGAKLDVLGTSDSNMVHINESGTRIKRDLVQFSDKNAGQISPPDLENYFEQIFAELNITDARPIEISDQPTPFDLLGVYSKPDGDTISYSISKNPKKPEEYTFTFKLFSNFSHTTGIVSGSILDLNDGRNAVI